MTPEYAEYVTDGYLPRVRVGTLHHAFAINIDGIDSVRAN